MKSSLSSLVVGTVAAVLAVSCAHQSSNSTPTQEAAMYTVLVSARFKSADPAVNKQAHDSVASATQQLAISRGDVAHKVVLDPADPKSFLAIDVWNNLEGMQAHFSDPKFLEGFGTIFEGPPSVRVFKAMEGGTRWGELAPVVGTLLVTVEARLAGASADGDVGAHNRVAEGGREAAQKLGDVTHLAHLSNDDPRQFMAIDIWNNPDGLKSFSSDPQAQQAFATLFTAPPKVTVYAATDYHQW